MRTKLNTREIMEKVIRELWGEPERKLKDNTEWRYYSQNGYDTLRVVLSGKPKWYDHEIDTIGRGVLDLIERDKGYEKEAAYKWLEDREFIPKNETKSNSNPKELGMELAVYPYRNLQGKVIYEVVKFENKKFRQRRSDGNGKWIWKMTGVTSLPYQLPKLQKAIDLGHLIFITEGGRTQTG